MIFIGMIHGSLAWTWKTQLLRSQKSETSALIATAVVKASESMLEYKAKSRARQEQDLSWIPRVLNVIQVN